MINLSFTEISKIIKGKLYIPKDYKEKQINKIVTDSRTYFTAATSIFFALEGPRNNGHNYISGLIEKGMNAFVISNTNYITNTASFILVEDTTKALQQLACYYRNKFNYPVIGITGSNGKTIVKEWLHQLLSGDYKIVRSPKSYNSQVGVPLSVLLMDNLFSLGIFEAGISQPGEMEKLAPIINPEVGIITNIGDAHQKNFISKKQKVEEKLKLFKNSKKLIFCADDKSTSHFIHNFCNKYSISPICWSLKNNKADIQFKTIEKKEYTKIEAKIDSKYYQFNIPFIDNSSVENACHCFSLISTLTTNPIKILSKFKQLAPVAMRLEIKQGINNSTLINDYYNSDIASLSIALSVLNQQAKKGQKHKIVILSDIQQTGLPYEKLYSQVNLLLKQWQIDEMIGIGPVISAYQNIFDLKKSFFATTQNFTKSHIRNKINNSAILLKGAREFKFENISTLLQKKAHQTILEIDLNAMTSNLNTYRKLLRPNTKIMAMVKAFSYGTGDVEIAKLLQYQNIDYLAVAVTDEGVAIRQAGIKTPIIVMNPEGPSFQNIIDYQLEPNIYSRALLLAFDKIVEENALQAFPIHIKLDTGMNRLGFKTEKELDDIFPIIKKANRLKIVSVFSHLATSDAPELDSFTHSQFNYFSKLSQKVLSNFTYPILRHILNSAGIERFPEHQMEMVRLGIGLYGISCTGLPLKNINTFKSIVSQVKRLIPGETVGYGRKGTITQETEIAIIPVGYADGMMRILGNRNGEAYIKGHKVPIIGNICMDMLMIDVTGLKIKSGDEVEFFGSHIPITDIAKKAGTIPYEIFTGISQRVKRIYLHE